jgi:hypothetical protein
MICWRSCALSPFRPLIIADAPPRKHIGGACGRRRDREISDRRCRIVRAGQRISEICFGCERATDRCSRIPSGKRIPIMENPESRARKPRDEVLPWDTAPRYLLRNRDKFHGPAFREPSYFPAQNSRYRDCR